MVPETRRKYEYVTDLVADLGNGMVDLHAINKTLSERSKDGWRLVTVFTNEVGKNSVTLGDFNINATMDHTILIFERKIADLAPMERSIVKEIPIAKSNVIDAVIPRILTVTIKGGHTSAAIAVYSRNKIAGIQCDLVLYNIFGDFVTIQDVCFYSMTGSGSNNYYSDDFPISIPDKIGRGLSIAGIVIKRYIDDEGLHTLDDLELSNISDRWAGNNGRSASDLLLEELNTCENTAEILMKLRPFADSHPEYDFEPLFMQLLETAKIERTYGSMKQDALNKIQIFFNAINKSAF